MAIFQKMKKHETQQMVLEKICLRECFGSEEEEEFGGS